ncbi:uncharacterized protein LOC127242575 [Andrographis paniculata]|uniref:uncharacterized protein LOC127242575 n=1 Tax=Andrographis paniculata TaxID=175694 RepID=UPI0021E97F99|nr:uncharacterized protein LOC127242575 [Andrographis paniculata]
MRKKEFSVEELNQIAIFLWQNSSNGQPHRGKINKAATKFGCSTRTISHIWKRETAQHKASNTKLLTKRKIGKGRPKSALFDANNLEEIHCSKRGTYRSISKELKVSKSSVGRWYKDGIFREHTNAIKPSLTEKNKTSRLRSFLQALEVVLESSIIRYKNMFNIVHIDDKWFNLSKENDTYYLAFDEIEPYRTCQSKRFITKIMFLRAVSRPLYGSNGEYVFDGKIEHFPFTKKELAKHNSKNRAAETMKIKPLDSITKEVTKEVLIDDIKVVTASPRRPGDDATPPELVASPFGEDGVQALLWKCHSAKTTPKEVWA